MKVGPAILLAAGVVVSAEAQKQSSSKSLEGMTTEDLRRSTNEFVVANADKIKPIARQRLLRHASKRRERNKGKYDDDEYDDDDWHGGAKWYGGFEDKWGDDWNGHGRSKSGKYSGKGGKSGGDDWYGDDDWHGGNDDLFYMLPSGCGNMCASSRTNGDKELEDSIEICQSGAVDQRWMVRSDDSYVMIESYAHPGKCIATDYTEGDTRVMLAEMCRDGILMLKDCHYDHGTEWYFTGGQLINSLCWGSGISTYMAVNIDNNRQGCDTDLQVWGDAADDVMRADTFMFVTRLPDAPFYIRNPEDPSSSGD